MDTQHAVYFVLFRWWCSSAFYSEQCWYPLNWLLWKEKSLYASEGERQEEGCFGRNILQFVKLGVASYFSPLPLKNKRHCEQDIDAGMKTKWILKCFVTNAHRKDSDLISTVSQGLWYTSSSSPDIINDYLEETWIWQEISKVRSNSVSNMQIFLWHSAVYTLKKKWKKEGKKEDTGRKEKGKKNKSFKIKQHMI